MRELKPATPSSRHDVTAFLFIGLLAIVLLAVAVGALVLPPGIAVSLIRRGIGEGRLSWVVLGVIAALLWLLFLYISGKRLMHRGRGPEPADDGAPDESDEA